MSEVGFASLALAHENLLCGKANDKTVRDVETSVPGWPLGHPWSGKAAVLSTIY